MLQRFGLRNLSRLILWATCRELLKRILIPENMPTTLKEATALDLAGIRAQFSVAQPICKPGIPPYF